MSRSAMLAIATIAAGAMGYGVAQAEHTTRQAPKPAETMYVKCNLDGGMSTTIKRRAKYCSKGAKANEWVVGFERSVRGCALSVMAATSKDFNAVRPGLAFASYKYEDEQAVNVTTRSLTGGEGQDAARSIYLVVNC